MGSFVAGAFLLPACIFASPIPEKPYALIERYCLDCHDSDTQKEVNLELNPSTGLQKIISIYGNGFTRW